MSSKLLSFYEGGVDDQNRSLDEILAWPDEELEAVHDFIQWLFPLPERSGANPSAPVLDVATIQVFVQSAELRERLRQSFLRLLHFYGLSFQNGAVQPAPTFQTRSANWLTPNNHNHLRLTRMMRSLRLLGLEAEAQALFLRLSNIYENQPGSITLRTWKFWKSAVESV
jgi:hypothetical protein